MAITKASVAACEATHCPNTGREPEVAPSTFVESPTDPVRLLEEAEWELGMGWLE